jgi:hypothetical protein
MVPDAALRTETSEDRDQEVHDRGSGGAESTRTCVISGGAGYRTQVNADVPKRQQPRRYLVRSFTWRLLGTGSAVLAATVVERGIRALWKATTGERPPEHPEDPDTRWGEAVAWAVISGAAVAVARLAATRRAARYYKESTGELPKALHRA